MASIGEPRLSCSSLDSAADSAAVSDRFRAVPDNDEVAVFLALQHRAMKKAMKKAAAAARATTIIIASTIAITTATIIVTTSTTATTTVSTAAITIAIITGTIQELRSTRLVKWV